MTKIANIPFVVRHSLPVIRYSGSAVRPSRRQLRGFGRCATLRASLSCPPIEDLIQQEGETVGMSYTFHYLQSESAAQGLEVIVLVNCLVQDAIRLKASDLHVEPWEGDIAVRARVNGVLTEVARLPLDLMEKVSSRFKVMSNLVTYQAGLPQDGVAIGGPEIDGVQLRVSIFPTTRGEKIVIRLFDPRDRRFDLGTLGFEESTLTGLRRVLKRTSGLVLFTVPTG